MFEKNEKVLMSVLDNQVKKINYTQFESLKSNLCRWGILNLIQIQFKLDQVLLFWTNVFLRITLKEDMYGGALSFG